MLKPSMSICVVDTRAHIGGNCYDYNSQGTSVHRYGPHIFHSPKPEAFEFLSRFTEWNPIDYRVEAEIDDGGVVKSVPFPYSMETEQRLGRRLDHNDIIDKFFRGYSWKMWGLDWESLPSSTRNRVAKNTNERSVYFPNEATFLPKLGYTRMIENMFDGVEMILGAEPNTWLDIPAKRVVYCGRPDLIPMRDGNTPIAEAHGLQLGYRSLDIDLKPRDWTTPATAKNYCHTGVSFTREISYSAMTGGASKLVGRETPRAGRSDELNPFYPQRDDFSRDRFRKLSEMVTATYPNLHLLGRLGTYRYIDMHVAVASALTWVNGLLRG